ncbi:MAG: nucleotidyltransferase family protein [Ruminococcus sp.]|nr:nucleotidyltransferase family protein [Ruminococcus sp.]
MIKSELSAHGRYLASLIGHSLKGTAPTEPSKEISWEKLYKLSVYHNVTALIYPAVSTLSIPYEIREKFEYTNHRHLAREARQELESHRVFSELAKNNINFIKLKGIVIKNLYPLPHMRSASDVDICMSKENRDKAKPIMESLGYKLDSSIDYHDEYSKDDFFIYEIHSDVMSPRSELYPLFINPLEKAIPDKSTPCAMVLSNEYFYLNLVIHLYKHFISEGCGLRLFSDIYLFRKKCGNIDTTFINNTLNDCGLLDFHNTVLKLNTCFFEGNEYSEELSMIADFIFKSGEYGDQNLKRLSWISSSKSAKLTFGDKVSYLLTNWFPGVKVMKRRYPILEKAPVLLPVCWIRRVFYVVFFKRSAIKEQRDEIKRLNGQDLKEAKKIRSLAGIK